MTAPPHDPTASRIRNLVVDRMLRMNARHATHAWLQRRVQPVGPHGLAFVYSDPAPDGPYHRVAAATRLVADADDVRDLARLIYRLTSLAHERYAGEPGGFDPRTETTTILQVVRNPGWLIPYISCALVAIGMLVHFGIYLTQFLLRRAAA